MGVNGTRGLPSLMKEYGVGCTIGRIDQVKEHCVAPSNLVQHLRFIKKIVIGKKEFILEFNKFYFSVMGQRCGEGTTKGVAALSSCWDITSRLVRLMATAGKENSQRSLQNLFRRAGQTSP